MNNKKIKTQCSENIEKTFLKTNFLINYIKTNSFCKIDLILNSDNILFKFNNQVLTNCASLRRNPIDSINETIIIKIICINTCKKCLNCNLKYETSP